MKKLFSKLMFMALAAITFTACEDVPSPYDIPGTGNNVPGTSTEIEGGTGTGSLSDPFNSIAALNYGKKLASGEESSDYYYIKGKVVSVKEEFTTQYGNGTFYISDDGTAANQFYAYRVLYMGNKKFANGDVQIKPGDDVIVCGKITNYNGTVETAQNKGFLYALNGENRGGEPQPATPGADPVGNGTKDSPYNVSGVLKYISTLGTEESPQQVYIKGRVSQVKEEYTTQYGNGTFYISDDGKTSNEFYVFRALYLGNKKFNNGDAQIAVGDEVIICGNVVNFRGNTPETVQNKSYLYSLNGVVVEENPDQPDTPTGEAKGTGTLADPYNPAGAIKYAKEVGDKESDNEVYIKGKVASIKDQYGAQYGNATFDISEDGTANSAAFTVYRALYLGNEKYTKGATLNVGDDVIVYGKVTNYRGNTPETVQGKAYLYSLNGATEPGGDTPEQPGGDVKAVTIAEFNAAAESNDVWYKLTGVVKNLKDGDQYGNFDLEDASGSVYVYGLLSEKDGAKKQFQALANEKGIKNGSKLTIIGNRGSYNGKIEVMNAYFFSIENDGDTPGEDPTGGDTTVSSLTNGGFETWADGQPTGWKSASTASSATLSQSSDAHGGKYSVNVNGKEGSNVRLASQEITLAAGTYVFSFYAKATTADPAQVRPGYVPVTDGKVGSYAYGDYATINNSGWTQVTTEFTLDGETTLCLVVMNPKKSNYSSGKDVLVDDATLTKK